MSSSWVAFLFSLCCNFTHLSKMIYFSYFLKELTVNMTKGQIYVHLILLTKLSSFFKRENWGYGRLTKKIRLHPHMHTCMHMHTRAADIHTTHMHTKHTHMSTHIHTWVHTHMPIHAHMCADMHTKHTHTWIYTNTHTHGHTHGHTWTRTPWYIHGDREKL